MTLSGIGLAGCGRMGAPMLAALCDAGFDARGFDIDLSGKDAKRITDDAVEFAKGLKILLTVVRDIPQTESVLFGAQGLVRRAADLQQIVICSTVSPNYIKDLRGRLPNPIRLVDAPMSGASIAAKERRLSFMLGGKAEHLAQLRPLFAAMGTSFHPMGDLGAGMSAKVLNNLLAASHTVMTRLVLDWAEAAQLDENKLLALIHASSGQNWFASAFDRIEFARDGYRADNSIGILAKDVLSAIDAAPAGAATDLPELLVTLLNQMRPKDEGRAS